MLYLVWMHMWSLGNSPRAYSQLVHGGRYGYKGFFPVASLGRCHLGGSLDGQRVCDQQNGRHSARRDAVCPEGLPAGNGGVVAIIVKFDGGCGRPAGARNAGYHAGIISFLQVLPAGLSAQGQSVRPWLVLPVLRRRIR